MNDSLDLNNLIQTFRSWSMLWKLDDLLRQIMLDSAKFVDAQTASIFLLEADGLRERATFPTATNKTEIDILAKEVVEKVIRHGEAIYAYSTHSSKNTLTCCVPMTASRGVLGAIFLEVKNKTKGLSKDQKSLIDMLGIQAASALENSILYNSAITDPLTNLYSHRHFQQECEQLIRRAERTRQPLILMILDLDHFKALNDSKGHAEGNKCLIRISEILQSTLRKSDIIARFGGDEFEFLLPDVSIENAQLIAEKILTKIEAEPFPIKITGTIGAAIFPDNSLSAQELFLSADKALYEGKKIGRNCFVRSTESPSTTVQKTGNRNTEIILKNIEEPLTIQDKPSKNNDIPKIDGQEIISRIATSSNGEVFLVRQEELDRVVALKRPLSSHLTNEQKEAFKKEALITASLSHPGVVPLYGMGYAVDGRVYYTMKPLKGVSLAEVLDKLRTQDTKTIRDFSTKKLIGTLLKTIETVAYAHNSNVAHLDIHPGNIIIGEFGEITLIDWGKGIKLDQENNDYVVNNTFISGNPIYRAPEMNGLIKKPIGKHSDVYSLGIILYEILTGYHPFLDNNTSELLDQIKNAEPIPPQQRALHKGVDPMLSMITMKAIKKNPDERVSATELVAALSRYTFQEENIVVVDFQKERDKVNQENWQVISGSFAFENGEIIADKNLAESIVFWKTPCSDNFSFTVEAYAEGNITELSIIALGKPLSEITRWKNRYDLYRGYCFQFGADNNLYTKLAKHGHDLLVDTEHTVESNRKYEITIVWKDSWLTCFIDKKIIFAFKELRPFKGQHIGFYAYGKGARFRPLEIKYTSTGLTTQTIKLADEHFMYNRFDAALIRYQEIARLFSDRLEGHEAKLKSGSCYAKLGQIDEANKTFDELANSPLEPYALVEKALLHLPENEYETTHKPGSYQKAVEIFSDIKNRFPNSLAIFEILNPCFLLENNTYNNHLIEKCPLSESNEQKYHLFKLGLETLTPPSQSQARCFNAMINTLRTMGKYATIIEILKNYAVKYAKFISYVSIRAEIIEVAYQADQWDLCASFYMQHNKDVAERLHPIILSEKFNLTEIYDKLKRYAEKSISWTFMCNLTYIALTRGEKAQLTTYYDLYFNEFSTDQLFLFYNRSMSNQIFHYIPAINDPKTTRELLELCSRLAVGSNDQIKEFENIKIYIQALTEFYNFAFDQSMQAIKPILNYEFKLTAISESFLLIKIFLFRRSNESQEKLNDLKDQIEAKLDGIYKQIAMAMLTDQIIKPDENWPKKLLTEFFFFSIYALYLSEKKAPLAHQILSIAENNQFGLCYMQPFILRLKARYCNHES